jgi:hypothetical protein
MNEQMHDKKNFNQIKINVLDPEFDSDQIF